MGLFGPSIKDVWMDLSNQIYGVFIKGGFFQSHQVVTYYKGWKIILDTYTISSGKSSTTYTRMRSSYFNINDFKFKIYRKSLFSNLGKRLGMMDLEIGFTEFDDDFIIKGNDEYRIKRLLSNSKIRYLISLQPNFNLELNISGGWFKEENSDGYSELCFNVVGVMTDINLLKALFELFSEVLDCLNEIDSANYSNHILYRHE